MKALRMWWDEKSIQTHCLSLARVNGTIAAVVAVALALLVELVTVVF